MNYRQVEVFKAIMDSGSITEAATMLRISQPAVSKALKLLEAEVGLRLFSRTTKGIAATEEARALYTEVERTYFGMQNLARFAANLRDRKQGRIVVSTIPALGIAWLPAMVARFSAAHPQVTVSLHSSNSTDAARLVGTGEIDLGIAQLRSEEYNLSRRRLFDLEGVIALPEGHPLTSRPEIRAEDLAEETIVALGLDDEFRRRLTQAIDGANVRYRSMIDAESGRHSLCPRRGGMRCRHSRQRGGTHPGWEGAGVSCLQPEDPRSDLSVPPAWPPDEQVGGGVQCQSVATVALSAGPQRNRLTAAHLSLWTTNLWR